MAGRKGLRLEMKIEIDEPIKSVLVVEDEAILSLMMEDLLLEMGATQVDCFTAVADAAGAARANHYDCAILDVRLRDGDSGDIASILAERGIPFVFTTGSDTSSLAREHQDRPFLAKPFSDDQFKTLLLDTHMLAGQR
ncbi:MAG: response regulator [Hyphomicrobiales bacterium]|nr:MAG: response regulator [Hyphomicrobiales bacterium]